MRSLSTTMKKKLASRIQAGDNAVSSSLWVARPTTPLTEDRYLEKQTVLSSSNITKTSIAVCHPRLMRGATEVYIGYLESGTIKVARTTYVEEMDRHVWDTDIGYSQAAEDFCLCFDGTMPKAPNGYTEFKTEQLPWVFWTLDGVLYGRKLWDESEPFVIAEANCSAVSAVRAMWSSYGSFDFGLIVFFLLNGQLYYRQLIGNEWVDAEIVSFGPSGISWEELAAFRTWDYRVGVQLKGSDGLYYEMFTQFMGSGKQNAEHIEIRSFDVESNFIELSYHNTKQVEHVEIQKVNASSNLYSTEVPYIQSAFNVEDENGDWGTTIKVVFSYYLDIEASKLAEEYMQFVLTDSIGVQYAVSNASIANDRMTVTLKFMNFNNAYGVCKIQYTPGSAISVAETKVKFTSLEFTPQNLVPIDVPIPEVESVWNE